MSRVRRLVRAVFVLGLIVVVVGGVLALIRGPHLPDRFVLEVVLAGPLRETVGSASLGMLSTERLSVIEVASALRAASSDKRVAGVLVRISSLQTGWAAAGEIRRGIEAVRRAGKPVVALLEAGGDKEYAVACAADSVFMVPAGYLLVDGLAVEVGFWKGTMDKVGLAAEVERIGEYKSAPETFTRTGMSREFRESVDALLDDLFEAYVEEASLSRGMEPERFRSLVDAGPYGASHARDAGLIDGLRYRAEVLEAFGVKDEDVIGIARYAKTRLKHKGPRVGYLVVEGTITPGKSSGMPFVEPTAGSETVARALRQAREDARLKGILVRVNSPGGSATASDVIWDELARTAASKPVVVSMGDVAASGGYYVAMPAHRIVAERTTITGSIGVFAGKLVAENLYDKIDYHVETIRRGRHADLFSMSRSFTEEERALLHGMLWDFYWNTFIAKAAQGRNMTPARVDSLARGRVWSGVRASRGGLVDTLGGVWVAKDELVRLLGEPPGTELSLVPIPRPKSLLERAADLLLARGQVPEFLARVAGVSGLPVEPGLMARMPCVIRIE